MPKNVMIEEYAEILASVRTYVEDQIELGFSEEPITNQNQASASSLFNLTESGGIKTYNSMDDIRKAVQECRACPLHKTRTNVVFGTGDENTKLVFVGEAPGADEDQQGKPFVGKAGQKLTQIINAISLSRDDVYITNVLKCRPPNNRNPLPYEIEACEPYLIAQLKLINPKIICALGTFAAQTLLRTEQPISRLRGKFQTYQGVRLMPTYHPAFLLRSPKFKKDVWEDVQKIKAEYDRE